MHVTQLNNQAQQSHDKLLFSKASVLACFRYISVSEQLQNLPLPKPNINPNLLSAE